MTVAVWSIVGVVALVALAVLSYIVETMGDRIAHGRSSGRRGA